MAGLLERENPFVADQSEQSGLLELQRRFDAPLKPQLVSPDGPPIELPETLYEILTVVVRELLAGHAVSILPSDLELTTTQAAEILHVSRPFLTTLLRREEIPHHMVGTHRRVRLQDVLRYRHGRDARREQLLAGMIEEADEAGLYDEFFAAAREKKKAR